MKTTTMELSNGDRVTVPDDGQERRSYWGHASTCSACFVGMLHTPRQCAQKRGAL